MKHLLKITAAGIVATTTGAMAGGIERSSQSVGILFEEGSYAEFSFSSVSPKVSGVSTAVGPLPGGLPSGNMAPSYQSYSFGYKQDLGESLSFALIYDQPVGADVAYPASAAPYPLAGAKATIGSQALNGLLRYRFPSNFSIYGGIRVQQLDADVDLPAITGIGAPAYTLNIPTNTELGYALGAAYEKPEIALRVALTHNSEITHTLADNLDAAFDVTIPKSWNLEFQSGVAADTLVFGSVRWVEWKAFNVSPPDYSPNPLASGKSNRTTYSLGIGRKFSDAWSGAMVLGYEGAAGLPVGNLAPTDGNKSIGLAASYKINNMKITAGVRYIKIGDATTSLASFSDNSAIGVGVKVGFSF